MKTKMSSNLPKGKLSLEDLLDEDKNELLTLKVKNSKVKVIK
jgi:hypothetical protein